jgi:hypothetical protein
MRQMPFPKDECSSNLEAKTQPENKYAEENPPQHTSHHGGGLGMEHSNITLPIAIVICRNRTITT